MPSDADLRTVSHNVAALRAQPTNDSGLVSQSLMGHTVRVLREENGWAYVEGEDTYRGWIDGRWLVPLMPPTEGWITTVFAELRVSEDADSYLVLRLPLFARPRSGEFVFPGEKGRVVVRVVMPDGVTGFLSPDAIAPRGAPSADRVAETAARRGRDFLGTPYLWGGASSFGLDCSGFVQQCYRIAGVVLRRDADIQRDDPRFVPVAVRATERAGDDLWPGDLVFFGKPDRITHVGMHLAGNRFIHSAGGAGVIITEWGDDRYSPGFVDARRLDPARAAEPVTRFESETR